MFLNFGMSSLFFTMHSYCIVVLLLNGPYFLRLKRNSFFILLYEISPTSVTCFQIHHELARLHAIGRFAPVGGGQQQVNPINKQKSALDSDAGLDALAALHQPENINWDAVLFHEEQAATLQCFDAVESLAQYYLGLPIDGPLARCPIPASPVFSPLEFAYQSNAFRQANMYRFHSQLFVTMSGFDHPFEFITILLLSCFTREYGSDCFYPSEDYPFRRRGHFLSRDTSQNIESAL